MSTKFKTIAVALIAAASLPFIAYADAPAAPEPAMTPAESAADAPAPMMPGMMGMRHGMGPLGDGQGKACQTRHGQMGGMGGMGMQNPERKCQQKCDMKQGGAADARIDELEKRLDLLQSMVQMMARQQQED